MNKRERVLAALQGKSVDHVPALFSLHFPKEVAQGAAAVNAHVDFFRQTGCDVVKVMNENLMPFIGPLQTQDDWRKVQAYDGSAPFITRQLDMLKRILDEVGGEGFSVATIHGVCASSIHPIEAAHGYERTRELLCQTLRENRGLMLDVHKRVTDTMCELAHACIKAGADGIYYAALGGEKHYYTDGEFADCIKPYDLQIMQAAREAGGRVFLHICKENIEMSRYADYGAYADVVNWGVYETGFSLAQGRELFPGSAILGGLANRSGVLVHGSDEEIAAEVRCVIDAFGNRRFLLGADCTLPTEISYSKIAAAVRAAVI